MLHAYNPVATYIIKDKLNASHTLAPYCSMQESEYVIKQNQLSGGNNNLRYIIPLGLAFKLQLIRLDKYSVNTI